MFMPWNTRAIVVHYKVSVQEFISILQAWVTLGRAQLNYGEPDNAIQSFDRALALKVRSSSSL
jgi:hypothetical protein